MRYELSFIISSAIPETDHSALQQEILGYLKDAKASITKEPYFIGRKKLAYPIKKQKHGFYVFLEFELEDASTLKELDTKLKHNNSLLRYLMIKLDKAAINAKTDPASFKDAPAPAKQPRRTPRSAANHREAGSRTREKLAAKVEPKPEVKEKSEAKPKVNLDDIDKKLDEILKDPEVD